MLTERYNWILNIEPGKSTRHPRPNAMSNIDLRFITPQVGSLDTWIKDAELSTPSEYEVMMLDQANSD